jgi:hypothetical protein
LLIKEINKKNILTVIKMGTGLDWTVSKGRKTSVA